jgi:hypothetical protein
MLEDRHLSPRRLPPVAAVVKFIDCINHGDVDGLDRLMSDDHQLCVFDEKPLIGRATNVEAWRGYVQSFPDYIIYPHRIAEHAGSVAVLGHTTGSHLGLADAEESQLMLIWLAEVVDGAVRTWRLIKDTAANRAQYGLSADS